jgi:periplasmic divalent cation tolerance protein
MTSFIEVYWTSGSLDEARKVSRYLVQERLVANAQIIPWFESIYMLNNQLETAQESKIVLITRLEHFEKIKEVIQQNTSYEVPQITFVLLDGGNKAFLEWVQQSTPDFSRVK